MLREFCHVMVASLALSSLSMGVDTPSDWTFACPRSEIAPDHWLEVEVSFTGAPTLALAGDDKEYAHGWWTTTIAVRPATSYEFTAHYLARQVEEEERCVLARLIWLDEGGERIDQAEYPRTVADPQEWRTIRQIYKSPPAAARATLELVYRWDADGVVYFGGVSFAESAALPPRRVRVAAVHHRPQDSTPAENLDSFKVFIERAGDAGADIVCLPEGITLVGTGKSYLEVSETVPGPTTRFLGELAREHSLYIVAGIYEKDGPVLYNTAVLLDRTGELLGAYRKVCLPREEIEGGITPGDAFPVFDTDFGRIGMMICWDVAFPEPARALARKGAEMICMPIWGGNMTLASARAIENQIYLVSSSYDIKTGVYARSGELIAEGTESEPVALIEIDLNERTLWPWLGDYRNRIPREMPSEKSLQAR
ncbi:carbon-nitrogen hydrolase family protein [candidate division KSB1 bacterium]|nr:carbon-nitrogen hydrolase family protein [candidate division KSB1 bacterium]RQW08822.1 MAG: carbon-nitrogen hydrolase family protein [candidate division KSB1 bacterium]